MWSYALKIAVSVTVIILVAEIGKRNSFWAALLASLPMTSLLAFVWLYLDTGEVQAVAELSTGIFWLVLASLPLFLVLPLLLRNGVGFWLALTLACGLTAIAYLALIALLRHLGLSQ